jgi:hypothetical protein
MGKYYFDKDISKENDSIENDSKENDSIDSEEIDDYIENEPAQFIDDDYVLRVEKPDSPMLKENESMTNMMRPMLHIGTDTNNWNDNANTTIKNWYRVLKQQKFVYQWVLDRNITISNNLSSMSIISSSLLGIFSAFKLWIDNDMFQTVSNIMLMLFNFIIALITSLSKRYIDDKRNEEITQYIKKIDRFISKIAGQALKSPEYRMDANDFFSNNSDTYTKLLACNPILSIQEVEEGKKNFNDYIKHMIDI